MPETVSSEQLYRGRVVGLRLDQVRLDEGRLVRMEVVEHGESVGVVALADTDTVILVRQYRHPTGETLLEIPAGNVDPGESPEACAQRELAEEIGYRADDIIPLGGFYLAPGWATEYMHIFLARSLRPSHAEPDEDEEIALVRMPLAELKTRIASAEVRDCKTLAALHLAREYLRP